jgi:hypothetical protein
LAAGAAAAGAAAGAAGAALPANAIPAPLMRRTARALIAAGRKRAMFIVTPWLRTGRPSDLTGSLPER